MFDFLSKIDIKFVSVIAQLEQDILYQNKNINVTFQAFCELLFKNIEYKETGIKSKRKTLGDYLNDDRFKKVLENDLYSDVVALSKINITANSTKHDANFYYDDKEVEKFVEVIFNLSRSVLLCYYSDLKINPKYDKTYLVNIINKRNNNDSNEHLNVLISKYIDNISVLEEEKRIIQEELNSFSNKESGYLNRIKELTELEEQIVLKNNEIDNLKFQLSTIEEQINENKNLEKKELNEKIRRLTHEKRELNKKIKQFNSDKVVNEQLIKDLKNGIIKEKDDEINSLKALIEDQDLLKNDKLYKLYLKSNIKLGFSSSYTDSDEFFIVTGVGSKCYSTSEYKSFYAVLNNLLQRGNVISLSSYLKKLNLENNELEEIYRLEMAILSLIRNNKLKDNFWKINYINGNKELLIHACNDIFYWMKLITGISSVKYFEPKTNFETKEFDDDFINIKYDNDFSDNLRVINIVDILVKADEDTNEFFSLWIDKYITYNVNESNKSILLKLLKELFMFDDFNEGQFEILKHTLNGNSTIGILPTGGGKSLIYQLSSLLQPKVSLVVAPLNSLIKDQIDGLEKKFGITRCLNITGGNKNKNKDLDVLRSSGSLFVFISPERLQMGNFRRILIDLINKNSIERIVLDEVHCLSEWGHDFRVSYLMLADTLVEFLGDKVKYLGLTATASVNVINDLIIELGLSKDDVVFLKYLRRKNLTFNFKLLDSKELFQEELVNLVDDVDSSLRGKDTNGMLIFCLTREKSDNSASFVFNSLSDDKKRLATVYHGKLEELNKGIRQDQFINNDKSILIATKSFGMGIDKPNIRLTIHYGIPSSFEAYYQEAGRAGRDKNNAECYLLTYKNSKDYNDKILKFFNENSSVKDMEFYKNSLKDSSISTNLYFFMKGLLEPEKEAEEIYDTFRIILKNRKLNNIILKSNDSFSDEKYLYVLHKLGIVSNWEKDYVSKCFVISLNPYCTNIDHIKMMAYRYIERYEGSDLYLNELSKISELSQLEKLILIVRKWYFNKFVLSRKNQLFNMYDKVLKFANRECSNEIQQEIDSYFDISNILYDTADGYNLRFENDSLIDITKYISEIDYNIVEKRKVEMGRVLESITTPNISLYTSLLYLISGDFDSRNGKNRFEILYNESEDNIKNEILVGLSENLYNILDDDKKEILLNTLYELDYDRLISVFLDRIDEDSINKKYWLKHFNVKINNILKGSADNE